MIINSMLDSDLYKISMCQSIVSKFPYAHAEYTFVNRGKTPFPADFHFKLQNHVQSMEKLALSPEEEAFLHTIRWLKPPFIDFLKGYRYNPDEVSIDMGANGDLKISIDGPYYRTVLWEVALMALVSELYFQETNQKADTQWRERAIEKAKVLSSAGIKFADFGTRRRFSFKVQDEVVRILKEYAGESFLGTSNVHLAMKHSVRPIGTQAHEFFSAHAAVYGYRMANRAAMETWVDEFGGDLGIVLPDTFTTDVFLRSFDKKFARLFDGCRQDSGLPVEFADKVIAHYAALGIDPMTKTIVFSDNLNCEKVLEIEKHCCGRIKTSYGIGTFFSNDIEGVKPLNIVVKLTGLSANGGLLIPCVKLSDVAGKHVGDADEISLCKATLNLA